MHPLLVNRVIFPVHEWIKGKPTHRFLSELERTQWLAPEALRELQFERLQRHLAFAYREIPYYQRLLDEREMPPWRIQSFEDFARVPFLTRDLIRDRFADLQPTLRPRGTRRVSSGGSTGSPVTVLVDPVRAAFNDAARLRAHRWFGADMGAREIVLWGSPVEVGRQDRIRSLRDRLLNSRLLSAFDMGEAALDRYADLVRRYRPAKLYGYASALALLAAHIHRTGGLGPGPAPRVACTTAEPLYGFQRAAIESTFACPVSVEYGCRDGGLVALECPAGSLHIPAEGMLVEVVPRGANQGEIVLTNLESWALPIIRYRTGDIGALDSRPCPCGRGLPILAHVEGRRTDFLIAPSGKVMHALAAIYILREVPGIRQFQVVQERLDEITVRVVAEGDLAPDTRREIVSRLGGLFDGLARIDLQVTSEIPSPAGKHRYVISRVADQYFGELVKAPR